MSASASSTPRRQRKELQPLATSHESANSHEGRTASTLGSVTLTNTSALPSPSIAAARAYIMECSPPIGQNPNALLRRSSLIESQQFPRRHSVLPSPGGLATNIANFRVSCPDQDREVVRETTESESEVQIDGSEDVPMTEDKQNDLVKVSAVATAGQTDTEPVLAAEVLRQVPFQYTHDRLRDWGYAYLGNTATADAFVNAVSLRRPSLQLMKETGAENRPEMTGMVTIRARVNPRAKERKSFMVQKKFSIEELRAGVPWIQRPVSTTLRRSNRARRSSAISSTSPRKTPATLGGNLSMLRKGSVPIHIEYALHFLPVLAALLLSGHVRKGDSIDLPVPHPEEWRDMVSYIYTGSGELTAGIKENILYLAGNA